MDTRLILTKARDTIQKITGDGTSFPTDLDESRFITIGVYDTDQVDMVNTGFSTALSKISELKDKAFKDIQTSTQNDNALWGSFGTKTGENAKLPQKWKENFYLPFPNALSESNSHTWSAQAGWANGTLGDMLLGSAAGGAIAKNMGAGDTTQKLAQAGGAVLGLVSPTTAGKNMLASGSALIAKMTGSQNYKFYENKIQMYDSSAFRSISLSWTLIPNNQKETKNLHEIVRKIKMYASPQTLAGKLLLRSPHFFKLDFNNDIINKAMQFTEVVVTGIDIQYSPGGSMELFHDRAPKSIELTINFTEREPKTHESWSEWNPNEPKQQKAGASC